MKYKLGSPEEVIRRALIHAIDERESFLDSHSNMESEKEYKELLDRVRDEISDFYQMYHRRYKDKTPKEEFNDRIKSAKFVDIQNL